LHTDETELNKTLTNRTKVKVKRYNTWSDL
jgi:hypothetical protein